MALAADAATHSSSVKSVSVAVTWLFSMACEFMLKINLPIESALTSLNAIYSK